MIFLGHDIYWCNNCQYGFVYPAVSGKFLANYYATSFRRNKKFNAVNLEIYKRRACAQYEFVMETLGGQIKTTDGTIVDIGCGVGAVVAHLTEMGYEAIGIEPDPVASDFGRENITPHIYSQLPALDNVQGIWLSHVAEHFIDIREELSKILALPGLRFIFIEIPNYNIKSCQNKKNHASHLHFYTAESFIKALVLDIPLKILAWNNFGPAWGEKLIHHTDKYAHSEIITRWDGYYGKQNPAGFWTRIVCAIK
ncbi:hypothetical protein FACS1894206_09570 [Deltaproteobacteria bacterium]|nr:hypothetical protein FACS1894206_09570 [Deltaproteobacteria bacterium]